MGKHRLIGWVMTGLVMSAGIAGTIVSRTPPQADHTTIEATSEAKAHYLSFFVRGGSPHNSDAANPVKILINEAYAVGYSEDRKNPIWSAYHVDETSVTGKVNGQKVESAIRHDRPDEMYTDLRTTSKISGSLFYGAPFERGHMTPNNAVQIEFGRLAQLETFFMSNMSPQHKKLNNGIWKKLEHAITEDLVPAHNDIWVIAGPIFGADPVHIVKGSTDTEIDVPDGFYMILVDQTHFTGTMDAIGFMFPNDEPSLVDKTLKGSVVPIQDIEAATNLDFFPELSATKQANLEEDKGVFDEWFPN